MIRNLKVMGLAVVALFAMSALFASAASAQFESEKEETTLTVSSNELQEFTISPGGSTVKCTKLVLDENIIKGISSGGNWVVETITIKPTYSECHELLGQKVTIDTNGCDYTFHLKDNETTGTTDVKCANETEGIEITVGSICTYKVGPQNGLGTVTYKNKGTTTTREVELIPNVTGITSTRTTNDFFCPGPSTEGKYVGSSTVTGSSGGEHVGVFVD